MSHSIEIPAKSFYSGSTKKQFYNVLLQKRKRLKLETEYKKRPLPNLQTYDHCFTERKVWKWFIRQQEAIDYCHAKNEKCLCIFAFEKANGKRSYLVTTRRQFWERYKGLQPDKRHFYEVIRQNDRCRLYFDIEYQYEFNRALDEESVLEIFINYFCYCVYKQFGIVCTDKHVIVLSSSTATKFSKHLILNHPGVMFSNNIQCGQFVKDCCHRLKEFVIDGKTDDFLPAQPYTANDGLGINLDNLSPSRLRDVLIKTEKGENFLCDLCVYTRNRNFRLYLSSKVSKHVPLELSENNRFQFKLKPSRGEKYLKYQMRNIRFDAEFERFSATLVCPGEDEKSNFLSFGSENKENIKKLHTGSNKPKEVYETGGQNSSFPELDKFIIQIVNRNGPPGHIRRWMYYEQSQLMIYDIGNNRWCGNIQREHKSNHIYFIADLKFSHVYQKCHDFECNDYRSAEIQIPREINPIFNNDDTIEEFDDSIDDELMELFDSDMDIVNDSKELQKGDEKSQPVIKISDNKNSMNEEFFTEEDNMIDEELLKLSGFGAVNVSKKRPSEVYFTEEDCQIDEDLLKLSGFDTTKTCQKQPNISTSSQENEVKIDKEILNISCFDALKVTQKLSEEPYFRDEGRLIDDEMLKLGSENTMKFSQESSIMPIFTSQENELIDQEISKLSSLNDSQKQSNEPLFSDEDVSIDEEIMKSFTSNGSQKRSIEPFFGDEDGIIDQEIMKLSDIAGSQKSLKGPTSNDYVETTDKELQNSNDFQKLSKEAFFSDEDEIIDEEILKLPSFNTKKVRQKPPYGSCDSPSTYLGLDTEEEEIENDMLNLSDDSFNSTASTIDYQSRVENDNSIDLFYDSSQFQDTVPIDNGSSSYSQDDSENELNELFTEDISISDI